MSENVLRQAPSDRNRFWLCFQHERFCFGISSEPTERQSSSSLFCESRMHRYMYVYCKKFKGITQNKTPITVKQNWVSWSRLQLIFSLQCRYLAADFSSSVVARVYEPFRKKRCDYNSCIYGTQTSSHETLITEVMNFNESVLNKL